MEMPLAVTSLILTIIEALPHSRTWLTAMAKALTRLKTVL
jgi:hypothetical protein